MNNLIEKLYYPSIILLGILSSFLFFSILSIPQNYNSSKYTICNDGTISHSSGSGTCSHHGGVDEYIEPHYEDRIIAFPDFILELPNNVTQNGWYNLGYILISLIFGCLGGFIIFGMIVFGMQSVFDFFKDNDYRKEILQRFLLKVMILWVFIGAVIFIKINMFLLIPHFIVVFYIIYKLFESSKNNKY